MVPVPSQSQSVESFPRPLRILVQDSSVLTVIGTGLLASMQVSVLAPALPAMATGLGVSTARIGLLITIFVLPGVFLGPFVGFLADLFGRRAVLVPALALWSLAGLGCFFVHSFGLLLALRFLQGIGSAPLYSLGAVILGDLYEGPERASVIGLNASILAVGAGVFPAVGGAVALLSWNAPFLVFATGLPVLVAAIFALDVPRPTETPDLRSYLKDTVAYVRTPRALSLYAAALLTMTMIFGAVVFYLPVLLAERYGTSSFVAGLTISILSFATAAMATQLGRFSRHLSEGSLAALGLLLYPLTIALLPLVDTIWAVTLLVAVLGLGHGLNMPSLQTRAAALAPASSRGITVTLLSVNLRLGMTLGPVAMGFFAGMTSLSGAFWTMSAVGIAGVLAVWPGLTRTGTEY